MNMREKTISFMGCVLLLSFLFSGCGSDKQPVKEEEAVMTNSELESMVRDKLDNDPEIKAANLTIAADAEKNAVTLSGTIASEDLRKRSLDLAGGALPGLLVMDNFTVKPQKAVATKKAKSKKSAKQAPKSSGSRDNSGKHHRAITPA
jgi:hypothetical protein